MVSLFYASAEGHVGICGLAMARVPVDVSVLLWSRAMLILVVFVSIEDHVDGLGLCYYLNPC